MQILRISDFILVFAMACCGPVRVCSCAWSVEPARLYPGVVL